MFESGGLVVAACFKTSLKTCAKHSNVLKTIRIVCEAPLSKDFGIYPWKLFRLLAEDTTAMAAELLADPRCLKDLFSKEFLRRFGTVHRLLGI